MKKLEIIAPFFEDIIAQGQNEGLFHCSYPNGSFRFMSESLKMEVYK